jgi:Protein of unknown function (DUF742)
MSERRVGWQPSRFLADRGEAERAIGALCRDILSIAEVSAHLHLPLGVVRVLVGDMADERLVMVHRPAHAGDRPDLALLERVLDGLRTI